MKFEPGQSGNPAGRPKGSGDRRSGLRSLLDPHAPALIEKAVEMALSGDMAALKLCLDRCLPAYRQEQAPQESSVVIGFEVIADVDLECSVSG
jgi:hypothetical protein